MGNTEEHGKKHDNRNELKEDMAEFYKTYSDTEKEKQTKT